MGLTGDSTSDRMRERNRPAGAEGFGTRMSNNSEDLSDLYENWESERYEAMMAGEMDIEEGVEDLDSLADEDDSYFYEEDSIDFLAEEDDRGDEDEDFIDLSDLFDDMEG